jgi:hypothetical protein
MVGPAGAATGAESYEIPYINSVGDRTQEYGADAPTELRIEIASTTAILDLRFYFGLSDFTNRSLRDRSGTAPASSDQGPAGEDESNFLLPIPAGTLVAGRGYDVTCSSGCYYTENGIIWHVVAVSGLTDTTTVLRPDPARLVRILRNNVFFEDSAPDERIIPGDVVRVISALGSWTPPGSTPGTLTVSLQPSGRCAVDPDVIHDGANVVILRDAVVMNDGSTVAFTMPQTLSFGYSNGVFIRLRVSGTTPPTGSDSEFVNSQGLNAFTAPYESPPAPTTTARATLTAATGGEIAITIPRLSRSPHSIGAVFDGTQTQLVSSTTPSRLRVLLPREVFQSDG